MLAIERRGASLKPGMRLDVIASSMLLPDLRISEFERAGVSPRVSPEWRLIKAQNFVAEALAARAMGILLEENVPREFFHLIDDPV